MFMKRASRSPVSNQFKTQHPRDHLPTSMVTRDGMKQCSYLVLRSANIVSFLPPIEFDSQMLSGKFHTHAHVQTFQLKFDLYFGLLGWISQNSKSKPFNNALLFFYSCESVTSFQSCQSDHRHYAVEPNARCKVWDRYGRLGRRTNNKCWQWPIDSFPWYSSIFQNINW
jgi:hypothetical protein